MLLSANSITKNIFIYGKIKKIISKAVFVKTQSSIKIKVEIGMS